MDSTQQPYAYAGNNPVQRTDPTGLDWWSEAGDNILAAGAGALSNLTMGASDAILGAMVPGYDCFISNHSDAYGIGDLMVTIVSVALIIVPGVGLAAAGLLLAKTAIKTAIKVGLKQTIKTAAAAARTSIKTITTTVGRTATRSADEVTETAAQSCRVNSFTAGTPVLMADGVSKPIEDVAVGDLVQATDPETGETGARPVVSLIRHSGEHLMVDITLDDDTVIEATDGHPFWSVTAGAFVNAIDLEVGDRLLAADGREFTVASTVTYVEDLTAYNLEIDGIHTYYAGETPVLVHNSCGLPTQLAGGPANVSVYAGVKNAEQVYSGISSNLLRRTAQHGDRFDELTELGSDLTRGEARAVEQALIVRSQGQNLINSISPLHSYYDDAVAWGEQWLRGAGL